MRVMRQSGTYILFHTLSPLLVEQADAAVKALAQLDGHKIGIKYCSLRYAKNVNYDDMDRTKPRIEIPALGGSKESSAEGGASGSGSRGTTDRRKVTAIQAIEAKLRALESRTAVEEFRVNRTVAHHQDAPISRYQFNLNNESVEKGRHGSHNHNKRSHRSHRPYNNAGGGRPRR